jgi:dsRNA-specific ribonuclease
LGDAILNFLIAEHFYTTTVNDKEKKMPKELHKMKTSVINNALLSLIVIENGIHSHVLYNNKALSFKEQFDKYVSKVHELLAMQDGGCTKDSKNALDLDQLYEYNLKIFGDVFESIIGAVFLDS